ncbi:MAG: hypothetical protein Harvfovirus62_9 [Harvfovirus sp.]|uniref:Uncharacterized protein n=1 Tax=Harvfovirus sp. TaxID=2487768 RepID=A0A3G5A3K2_9VIRU|nr:MAG: hypothetical protein Harvfovirus62_9 [Harvfovirus sp.]
MSHIFTELSTLSSLKTLSLTHRSHDEIIYETTEPPPYELKSYLEKNYPNMFHIKTFQLLQLGKKPFYVKEYSTGTTEFKCTPKKFLCQAIRYYQKDPPGTLDLKFTDEQQTATYDHPLNFDS